MYNRRVQGDDTPDDPRDDLDYIYSDEFRQDMKRLLFLAEQNQLVSKGIRMDLTAITADVAAETTADQSAVTLLTALSAEIQSLAATAETPADSAALAALATQLSTNSTALAAAVVANTPAAPAAPVTPPAS